MKKALILFIVLLAVVGMMLWKTSEKTKTFSPALIATATYYCNNNQNIIATFYEGEVIAVNPGEPPVPTGSVKLTLSDGRKLDLNQTISGSGVRYANSDESFVFWNKGDSAMVLENNIEKDYTNCATKNSN